MTYLEVNNQSFDSSGHYNSPFSKFLGGPLLTTQLFCINYIKVSGNFKIRINLERRFFVLAVIVF